MTEPGSTSHAGAHQASASTSAGYDPSTPITIVLADDHRMVRSGLRMLLESDDRWRVLEEAGLLTREKRGRTVWCRLNAAPLRDVVDWATRYRVFWEEQFDSLAAHLERQSLKDERR